MTIHWNSTRAALALTLALAATLAPRVSLAQVPSPATSFVQNVVVGSWDGKYELTSPQPCAGTHAESFVVIVRDAASLPVPGASIKLVFAGSGIAVCAGQNAGITANCVAHEIGCTTDASGVKKFTPRFGGYNTSPSVGVYANGILLATIPAISSDFDGDGKISLLDFNTFATDYLGSTYSARTDFDNCPTSVLNDLTWMASQYFASLGTQLSPMCP